MVITACIYIIFILLIIHTMWPKYVYDAKYGEMPIIDIFNNGSDADLRTGDIICVRNCEKCKYSDNTMNNVFQYVYRNMFNAFRWYITNQAPYTHTAVVIRLNINGVEKPYICHMDGGMPMYDEITRSYVSDGVVVSSLHHIDVCGGMVHMYKYKGPPIKMDIMPWILSNNKSKYPRPMYSLIMANALKLKKNPDGVMACTDFVENTLNYMNILDKKNISGQSTINDICNITKNRVLYNAPVILKNKCCGAKHFA
jgi:hypothetical protein